MSFVEFQQASKRYGNVDALKPTDIRIEAGEYVAIVGKSGSGKTTFLNLIAGLDSPSGGQVLVDGLNIGKLNEKGRAKWRATSLGIVFQFFQLLPTISVRDNILLANYLNPLARKHTDGTAIDELLELVGIAPEGGRLPPTLSGGQQQRAAIARALVNDPRLIVLDEPTGSVDSESTQGLLAVLDGLHARGRTLILVTHDEDVASRANRRVELRDGAIISDERVS